MSCRRPIRLVGRPRSVRPRPGEPLEACFCAAGQGVNPPSALEQARARPRPSRPQQSRLRPVVACATGQGDDLATASLPSGHRRASCLQPVVARLATVLTRMRSFLRYQPGRQPVGAWSWPSACLSGQGRASYLRTVVAWLTTASCSSVRPRQCRETGHGLMLVRPATAA